ncbi:sulfatase-like hydrolase/transferase [Catenovulum maritimum]|uniref:Sulfatase n=1 Tax=Catenovulum maritimum TaxID=1513271 RepID=A0A0J8H051_9ALTE|nr:sulfatase-like hydrolase/transferase [Catenovulum maritimum]KMT66859.1 sulfatase [Catenovulum maritimum]
MNLTRFLIYFLITVSTFNVSAEQKRPNILVILSDDAGFTDLGSFGGEVETPNLDKLAAQGMRFSAFYSNARCSPTRASLLTGLDSAKVGFGGGVVGDWVRELPFEAHRGRLPYDQPLISELLGDNGYQTLMVGKWHLGGSYIKDNPKMANAWRRTHPPQMKLTQEEMELDYLALPPQRGFQESFVFHGAQGNLFYLPNKPHEYWEGNKRAKLKYDYHYDMHCYAKTPFAKKMYSDCHGKKGNAFYATDGMTDRAVEMIADAAKKEDPFFMYVAYRAPHKPLQAPEELVQKYLARYSDLQKVADNRHKGLVEQGLYPKDAKVRNNNYMWTKQAKAKIEEFRLMSAVHSAMMEKMDENIGKLIQGLKDSGEYDNTLILYMSDNGSASHIGDLMNAPFNGVKALLWEGGARAHAIAAWPNVIKENTINDDVVWVGDLMPTFLEMANVDFPKTYRGKTIYPLDGRSVLASLKGEKMAPPEAIFNNDKGQQSVIYQGRWKLLIEPGWYLQTLAKPGINVELYDLSKDPGETTNLVKKMPDLVAKLTKMCEQWKLDNKITDYAEIIKLKPSDPY